MRILVLAALLTATGVAASLTGAAAQTLPPAQNPGYAEQQPQRQRPMMGMRSMDADNDGVVSREEFMTAHQAADTRFAAVDGNKDGIVSREEFLAAGQQNREAQFRALDSNGDGRIAHEELAARRTAIFDAMDSDRDGRLTPQELRRNGGRMMAPPQQSQIP